MNSIGDFLKLSLPYDQIQIECDQLVYSIGQDDKYMRKVCKEIDQDLVYNFDINGMLLNVCSQDRKVNFFGAAAMAVREKIYIDATWNWLQKQNIGGDVGPGSMPPSRAQIKRFNSLKGIAPESINANIDSNNLIVEYLCNNKGIESAIAVAFVEDLLAARKYSTSGCTNKILKELLEKYRLNEKVEIYGHGHLILKKNDKDFMVSQEKDDTIVNVDHLNTNNQDFRDINEATREELIDLIHLHYEDILAQGYADLILKIRDQNSSGLRDLSRLEGQVPAVLVNVLKKFYFPPETTHSPKEKIKPHESHFTLYGKKESSQGFLEGIQITREDDTNSYIDVRVNNIETRENSQQETKQDEGDKRITITVINN